MRPQLTFRPPTPDDAESLLPVFAAYDLATVGEVDVTLADVDMLLRDPRADLAAGVLVADASRQTVGLMLPTPQLEAQEGELRVDLELMVHPELGTCCFEQLLEMGESYVAQLARTRQRRVEAEHWSAAEREAQLLLARGFRVTRTHARFSRKLAAGVAPPPLPSGVRVVLAATEQQRHEFYATLVRGFAHDAQAPVDDYCAWAERMASSQVHDPSQWWLLQIQNGGQWRPAGMLQGNRQDHEAGGAWVKNFAVLPEHRGRGLGRLLLEWSLAEFAGRGYRRVGLGADLENTTNALRLYERAGFERLYTARRFTRAFG